MAKTHTTEEFIQRSIEAHKPYHEQYDYSKTEYIKSSIKVIITCKFHGDITVNPADHLRGTHCRKCANILASIRQSGKPSNHDGRPVSRTEFFRRANERYGRFDYNKSVYKGMSEPIIIKCSFHGEFKQTPSVHLSHLTGCPECNKIVAKHRNGQTTAAFIEKARKIHGWLYGYDNTKYIHNRELVIITCPDHGDFTQTPNNHLKGHGCSKCWRKGNPLQNEWIKYMEEQTGCDLVSDHVTLKMGSGKIYYPDAYDPITKTVYEFNGDYYHGNPTRYEPDVVNTVMGKTMGELLESTINKKLDLEANGYTVLSIWESEWNAFKATLPDITANKKAA